MIMSLANRTLCAHMSVYCIFSLSTHRSTHLLAGHPDVDWQDNAGVFGSHSLGHFKMEYSCLLTRLDTALKSLYIYLFVLSLSNNNSPVLIEPLEEAITFPSVIIQFLPGCEKNEFTFLGLSFHLRKTVPR